MKKIISLIFAILAFAAVEARTYSVDELPNVQVTDHTKHLVNPDGIIDVATQSQIDSLLADARRVSSAELVVVVVDDINDPDIDMFATRLFNKWGIGKKDKNNGILMIVAKDSHMATIRTGYGAEGVMPDILAGRIINNVMIPKFREEDYQGGVLDGVKEMHRLVTDPEAAEELKSQLADARSDTGTDPFDAYLWVACFVAVLLIIWMLVMLYKVRGCTDYEKYVKTADLQMWSLVLSMFFLFIPVIVPIIVVALRQYWRNHPRKCMRCGAKMNKLDEDRDNQYLTMAQDAEEKLNSVDYDVWLCPECGKTDIYPYINKSSAYKECGYCHARALKLSGTTVLQQPTTTKEGIGTKNYTCLHCHKQVSEPYRIPKKEVPVVIMPIGGGRGGGGGFGGGSFGGGFGGGMTGGGGATGRW